MSISHRKIAFTVAASLMIAAAHGGDPFAPSRATLEPDPTLLQDCNTAIRDGTMRVERAGEHTMRYGMTKYVPTMIQLGAAAPEAVRVEPAYAGTVRYGKVTLGGKSHAKDHWLAIETLPGEHSKFYFDRNGNGDLTDDGPGEWDDRRASEDRPASFSAGRICEVERRDESGRTRRDRFGLNFYWTLGGERAGAYGSGACRGEIEVAGETVPVVLIDLSNSADFFTGFPVEGGYEPSTRTEAPLFLYVGNKSYDARGTINHGGVNYVPRTTPDGRTLVLEPTPRIIPIPLSKAQREVEEKKLLATGVKAPMFEAVDINGKPFRFADQVGKKVIVLDFWATWCGPCVSAMPHLADIKRRASGEAFEIVAVNVADNETAYKKYAAAHSREYGFPLVRDPAGRGDKHNAIHSKHYGVRALPTTFVIDKEGVIRAVFTGFADEGRPLIAELEKLGVRVEASDD